jgi:peroxiredoxin Q/BCP
VVGVSADSAATQRKFIEKFGLTFPLVPDPEKVVIDDWGVRKVLGVTAQRSTFLVDPRGRIAYAWPKVNVEGHGADVIATIRRLSSEF